MGREITILRPGAPPARRLVEGPVTLGGSHADEVLVPGLAPGALRLVPAPAGLVVEAAAPGVRVGGRPAAPGERRLLRPGERAAARGIGIVLERTALAEAGTRCAAAALLRDAALGATPALTHVAVLTGPGAGALHPLGPDQTVGRGRAAGIRIADPRASRLHARLRVDARGATVEDLGSRNGVRVNGVRIEPRRAIALAPGDELRLGDTLLALDGGGGGAADAGHPASRGRRPGRASRLAAVALLALAAAALALAGT